MAADFDPNDRDSWYFGTLRREETNGILQPETSGTFLVRDSSTIRGDFVLCVKEENKVSHYIINKMQLGGKIEFRIGDQTFVDLPGLLNFYKTHYLDTTSLIKSAPREQYRAKYDFAGRDPEDLPFKKGEVMTILLKDEDQWWTAKNAEGRRGQVPVPYIERYDDSNPENVPDPIPILPVPVQNGHGQIRRELPAKARVIRDRVPCAYDTTQLRLKVGDDVLVTTMHMNGQWEGEVGGKTGFFPFTHIEFIDTDNTRQQDEV